MQKTENFDSGVYAPDAKQLKQPLPEGVFNHPFSREFWKDALLEFKNWRTLVFAALIISMRIMIKAFKIPIVPGMLYFGFDFIINSAGSMIYGPIVALVVGAVSDQLGSILFPTGPYFFPFIFVEMLSGFIFGMFLYRQKPTTWRVVLSRLAVVVMCNYIVNPIIMTVYQRIFFCKPYTFITLARVAKNIALFPIECIVLVLWLNGIWRALYKLNLVHVKPEKLVITWKHYLVLGIALVLSVLSVFGYIAYKKYVKKKKEQSKSAFGICNEQILDYEIRYPHEMIC